MDIITDLHNNIPGQSPPEIVTKCKTTNCSKVDFECESIEKDFAGRERDSLTDHECSMSIIDSALITDGALLYFLPRLVKAVIEETGDSILLRSRLKQIQKFTPAQGSAIKKVISVCEEIETRLEKNG